MGELPVWDCSEHMTKGVLSDVGTLHILCHQLKLINLSLILLVVVLFSARTKKALGITVVIKLRNPSLLFRLWIVLNLFYDALRTFFFCRDKCNNLPGSCSSHILWDFAWTQTHEKKGGKISSYFTTSSSFPLLDFSDNITAFAFS